MSNGQFKKCEKCKKVYFEEKINNPRDVKQEYLNCPNCNNQLYSKADKLHAMPKERNQELINLRKATLDTNTYEIMCASCKSMMVRRENSKTREVFYGCSMFGITGCNFTLTVTRVLEIKKVMKAKNLKKYYC